MAKEVKAGRWKLGETATTIVTFSTDLFGDGLRNIFRIIALKEFGLSQVFVVTRGSGPGELTSWRVCVFVCVRASVSVGGGEG